MSISKEEVQHVAHLAKLSVSDNELDGFVEKLNQVIEMVQTLEEVDTTGVAFTSNPTELLNVMREDIAVAGTAREELMKNVPESQDGFIKVPAIMDNGEGDA